MADLKQDGVFIQVRIEEQTERGVFNDSLYFSLDEFDALKNEDLVNMKTERFQNWLTGVQDESNKPLVELTEEELIKAKEALQEQKSCIEENIADIDLKISGTIK